TRIGSADGTRAVTYAPRRGRSRQVRSGTTGSRRAGIRVLPGFNSGGLYARGGPGGENPTGTFSTETSCGISHCFVFDGSVTCLRVSGNRAVVGAVGTARDLG